MKPAGDEDIKGAARALMELDHTLMKLLVRRATLVSRIRAGKDNATGTAAIQAEKAVRVAWETAALSFSKDPRFSRQLFHLLQDIKVLSKERAELSGSFNLAPPAKPVSGTLTGPTAARAAQMRLALAVCLGSSLKLHPVMFSDALGDTYKAFEQAGGRLLLRRDGPGLCAIEAHAGPPLAPAGKNLYLGEDPFTLYMMLFMALGRPGVLRLNGGTRLKSADLSSLRHALPLFGARLAHIVPRSQGLPATLECSGEIPQHVLVPAELPFEAYGALLLAAMTWNVPVTLDISALPAAIATAALAEVRPLQRDSGAEVETHGPRLIYSPARLAPPAEPALPLDPVLSAYLLCVPAFAGGSLTLKGLWPSRMPEAAEAEQLFAWAGLEFSVGDNSVSASLASAEIAGPARRGFSRPMQIEDISPTLGPLFLALGALCFKRTGAVPPLRRILSFPVEDTDQALAQEFFARLGLVYGENGLITAQAPEQGEDAQSAISAPPSWTSPDAYWSMALALAAFVRPGQQLANPGNVTPVMPAFWGIYNSLPNPADPREAAPKHTKEATDDKIARRRILAD